MLRSNEVTCRPYRFKTTLRGHLKLRLFYVLDFFPTRLGQEGIEVGEKNCQISTGLIWANFCIFIRIIFEISTKYNLNRGN